MNTKTKTLLFALMIIGHSTIQAQLKVHTNGNIGIDATAPVSRFTIGGNGYADCKVYIYHSNAGISYKALRVEQALPPSGTYLYGIHSSIPAGSTSCWPTGVIGSGYRGATPYSSGRTVGVRGHAGNATSGWNYGIYGELVGTQYGAAVYGVIPGRIDHYMGGMYAGYFNGNVQIVNDLNVDGVFTNSDINLKKDIASLEGGNLAKLQQLQAIRYKVKTPIELTAFTKEVTDTARVLMTEAELREPLYTRDHIGISAQEIRKVYPEIVKEENNGYLSVNYIALIPILLEAIKEQQATIEELRKKVDKLTLKSE